MIFTHVDSSSVQVASGRERTHIKRESIGCSDPYVMVNSRFEQFLEAEQSIGCTNEIDKYLAENWESRRGDVKFEILGWWKANSDRYQVLSKLARDVLAVPVSTVASESAFSTGGRILDHFKVHYLHSWFKILFVHKTGFKPWFKFLFANQRMR